jgi:hypothetical protein
MFCTDSCAKDCLNTKAESLLTKLEILGMVPPQIFVGKEHDIINAYICQWEDE